MYMHKHTTNTIPFPIDLHHFSIIYSTDSHSIHTLLSNICLMTHQHTIIYKVSIYEYVHIHKSTDEDAIDNSVINFHFNYLCVFNSIQCSTRLYWSMVWFSNMSKRTVFWFVFQLYLSPTMYCIIIIYSILLIQKYEFLNCIISTHWYQFIKKKKSYNWSLEYILHIEWIA